MKYLTFFFNILEKRCEDGKCITLNEECTPYNGCPIGTYECSSGDCVTSMTQCLCFGTSLPIGCFDGTCVANISQCPQPVYQIQIVPVAVTIFQNVSINLDLIDTKGNEVNF